MLNKSDNAMHRTAVKAFLIKFAPRKSQQIFFWAAWEAISTW